MRRGAQAAAGKQAPEARWRGREGCPRGEQARWRAQVQAGLHLAEVGGVGGGAGKGGQGAASVEQLAMGRRHTCARRDDGTVLCWGNNSVGQLGGSPNAVELLPVLVPGLQGVTFLAAGGDTTCALTKAQEMYCWGAGEKGQTFVSPAPGTFLLTPTKVPNAPAFVMIGLGETHGCGLTMSGDVHCWGNSLYIGGATTNNTKLPIQGPVTELAVGGKHACARQNEGIVCWGDFSKSQLGSPQGGTLVKATNFSPNGKGLALGYEHSCQMIQDGTQWRPECLGANAHGQLGLPSSSSSPTPGTQALELKQLAAGGDETCAITQDKGEILCWGANDAGQLGDGFQADSHVPVKIVW